ncbi:fungal-specific transcription factor domain-containing protein [Aspergillus cavernicola]|uniref:Fungal-specific transcription factor domain-containing protein n=1 Tax=Aspergillus cavernicola TaxID=176166 RepID=A0ABR4IUG3_9EURO
MTSQKGKKTNSLAFARTDCHTCTATEQVCDRQRPQCTTCLNQGRQCGGFATPLSWDNGRMWLGRPAGKSDACQEIHDADRELYTACAADENADGEAPTMISETAPARHFRFVTGKMRSRKRRRVNSPAPQQSPERQLSPAVLPNWELEQVRDDNELGLRISDDHVRGLMPFLVDDLDLFNAQDCLVDMLQSETTGLDFRGAIGLQDLSTMEGNSTAAPAPDPIDVPIIQHLDETINVSFPYSISGVLPPEPSATPSLRNPGPETRAAFAGDQHQALLRLYDTEFCVLPLTSDTALNPFRCSQQTSRGSRLLFHAILAICCQHLNRLTGSWASEAEEHRVKAAKLLNEALQQEQLSGLGLALLDPILVMITLDCTISAIGPWVKHLNRVRSILEFCGGPTALNTPRTRSQVAMVIWWDATLALVSRQGTILSNSYLDHLVRCERADQWSFYDLTGCPGDLVVHLFQLAELSKQNEIATSMTWLTFDPTQMKQIERQIRHWNSAAFASPCLSDYKDPTDLDLNEVDESGDEEEAMHAQQDRYHCAEAWRYALLIYIERVLKWDRGSPRSKALTRLVRTMLNHVRCCRRTSQTQKQLLLPMFLAGSETRDGDMRDFVITYSLLKEVWAEDDSSDSGQRQWWGTVVDRRTGPEVPGQIPAQFLLG